MDSLQEGNVAPESAPKAPGCRAKAEVGVIALEAEFVPHTEAQRAAFEDALRLLAVWAVRAARPVGDGVTQGR
jgi:hypothetical protein